MSRIMQHFPSTAWRYAIFVLLLSVPITLASPTGAAAQAKAPITPAQLGVIEDMVAGSLGHDQTVDPPANQMLGLHSTAARQMSGSEDPTLTHFFNLFASDPGALILSTLNAGVVRAYRVDNNLQYVRGFVSSNGKYTMFTAQQGAAGATAELAWWGKAAADVITESKKALASGKSPADVAKGYGVSADTLNKWLAAAK
jgi:hypothetical protein